MGITFLWRQVDRATLIGDRPIGITQGQANVAAIAQGSRIIRTLQQHLIPQRQCLGEVTAPTGG